MKAKEAPEKLYIALNELDEDERTFVLEHRVDYPICTEYTRTDAFIEKASEWFKIRYEWIDIDGTRNYDKSAFEDFKNYMKGE